MEMGACSPFVVLPQNIKIPSFALALSVGPSGFDVPSRRFGILLSSMCAVIEGEE
jgi:hypothetical protein